MDFTLNKTILNITDKTEEFKKKDFFIKVGQVNRRIGIVRKGVLRGFIIDDNGNEVNLILYKENDIISGNVVPNVPASINVQAIEKCIIDVTDFPKALLALRDNEFLNTAFNEMVNTLHSKIQYRLTSFINCNSFDRYQFFLREYPNLINRIPNYHIANFLGITPTQLSRIRKSFANK
jgi:CRP/FNR family transcriptional regulator, anaerobic regulatory protein